MCASELITIVSKDIGESSLTFRNFTILQIKFLALLTNAFGERPRQ
jgi:hypothetical protein